jgi:hypothetical protein
MKTLKTIMLAGLLSGLAVAQAPAQFSSGSDGSDGPLVVTNDTTFTVRSNGIYNHTTIHVASGATLRFVKNVAAGNYPVYLLATGDVAIDGTIDVSGQNGSGVSGQGGPGGFDGGEAGIDPFVLPGDGLGPGGGERQQETNDVQTRAGGGSYAQPGVPRSGTNTSAGTYGNRLVMPLIGGSGGGGSCGWNFGQGRGGGGGGGAILIASSTKVQIDGQVQANGGASAVLNIAPPRGYWSGGGSGGVIRVVAAEVVGNGMLSVYGGPGPGGFGWIRIDTFAPRQAASLTFNGVHSIGSFMQVFPSPLATLSIVQAAGTNIVEGQVAPVIVALPQGSPTDQTVTVRARDFVGTVPIRVVLTPESGPSSKYDDVINMGATNVAEKTVSVVMPVNTLTRIHAWTR